MLNCLTLGTLCSAETEILDSVLVPIAPPGKQQILFSKAMVSQGVVNPNFVQEDTLTVSQCIKKN